MADLTPPFGVPLHPCCDEVARAGVRDLRIQQRKVERAHGALLARVNEVAGDADAQLAAFKLEIERHALGPMRIIKRLAAVAAAAAIGIFVTLVWSTMKAHIAEAPLRSPWNAERTAVDRVDRATDSGR